MALSVSTPAAKQKRSKLADTSSKALPTGPFGMAVVFVLNLFMALLSFRGISTPSLPAQGEQRRSFYFNIRRDIPTDSGRRRNRQENNRRTAPPAPSRSAKPT